MPDEPDQREAIVQMLKREKDEHRRKLLEKALNEPENRGKWMEAYFHAWRNIE